jgi:hypothetical protein
MGWTVWNWAPRGTAWGGAGHGPGRFYALILQALARFEVETSKGMRIEAWPVPDLCGPDQRHCDLSDQKHAPVIGSRIDAPFADVAYRVSNLKVFPTRSPERFSAFRSFGPFRPGRCAKL